MDISRINTLYDVSILELLLSPRYYSYTILGFVSDQKTHRKALKQILRKALRLFNALSVKVR